MNWEETIEHIRKTPSYAALVQDAYLGADLKGNVERFRNSQEYKATLVELKKAVGNKTEVHILDIGAGNGISTIAFALDGYKVTASEPDPSSTIGAGAIRKLISEYKLNNVEVIEEFGEALPFEDGTFDVVYGRQVMHHAYDLSQFAIDLYRVLKKDGVLITTRDHVVENASEKEAFLKRHPLQKYYGGENAFSVSEYSDAIKNAGFDILNAFGPSDSPINYAPWTKEKMKGTIASKLGSIFANSVTTELAWKLQMARLNKLPGRLYSFVAIKK